MKEFVFNVMSFWWVVDLRDTIIRFEILTIGTDEESERSLFMFEFENKRLVNLELLFFQVVPKLP